MDVMLNTGNLVYAAMLAAFAGFILTDQLWLRILVLLSSAIYIIYYYVHTPEPQWSAIISSAVVASANVFGLMQLILSRMTWFFTAEQRKLYKRMPGLEPGEFRELMRAGVLRRNETALRLTEQDARPDSVYFVFDGNVTVSKSGASFDTGSEVFIAEVSFMLKRAASATCTLSPGSLYIVWDQAELSRLLDRKPRLQQAFDAQIARDMARKVATGIRLEFPDRITPDDFRKGAA